MIKSLFVIAVTLVAAPLFAQAPAPERPFCSATIIESCQQTRSQEARAMSGAQADARDARSGGQWSPDKQTAAATAAAKKKK